MSLIINDITTYVGKCPISTYQWIYTLTIIYIIYKSKPGEWTGLATNWYAVFIFFIELPVNAWYISIYESNLFLMNIYANSSLLFLVYIYTNHLYKVYSLMYSLVIITISIIGYFTVNPYEEVLPTYPISLGVCIFLIFKYFFHMINSDQPLLTYQVLNDYRLYLGLGVILFYCSAFPLLVFFNETIHDSSLGYAYFKLIEVGNLFMSLGLLSAIIVLWKNN